MWWRRSVVVALAGMLVGPGVASACDFYLGYTFMAIPSTFSVGAGVALETSDPSITIFNGDVAIGLNDRAVLRPAVGLCHESDAGNGDSDDTMIYGGGFGVQLLANQAGTMQVNLQGTLAYASYGEEVTGLVVPVGLAGRYVLSDAASIFFGGFYQIDRYSVGDESFDDNNPAVSGGAAFGLGSFDVSAGLAAEFGDDTDITVLVGLTLPIAG